MGSLLSCSIAIAGNMGPNNASSGLRPQGGMHQLMHGRAHNALLAMICFDREFPESARILMLKGAEIILTPNACEMDSNRICQFKTRAYENIVGVALTNYAAPQQNGHSCAFDAIAFDEAGLSRDMTIVMASTEEAIIMADFNMEKIRAFRQREVWGNAYRKPQQYQSLISTDILDPFKRNNAKR